MQQALAEVEQEEAIALSRPASFPWEGPTPIKGYYSTYFWGPGLSVLLIVS